MADPISTFSADSYDYADVHAAYGDGHSEGYTEGYADATAAYSSVQDSLIRLGINVLEPFLMQWDAAEGCWIAQQGKWVVRL